jgi:hypothetical protein
MPLSTSLLEALAMMYPFQEAHHPLSQASINNTIKGRKASTISKVSMLLVSLVSTMPLHLVSAIPASLARAMLLS